MIKYEKKKKKLLILHSLNKTINKKETNVN